MQADRAAIGEALVKSLRSIMRATVYLADSWIMPRAPRASHHSLL